MDIVSAWLLLIGYLALAATSFRKALGRLVPLLRDATPALLLVPYLLATGFTPPLVDLLRMVLFIAIPVYLLRQRSVDARPFDAAQVVALLAIWVPLETSLFVLLADLVLPSVDLTSALQGFYLIPELQAPLFGTVMVPVHTLTGVWLVLFLFLVRFPIEDIGFSFRFKGADIGYALAGLGLFAAVGIPIGLGAGFLSFNLHTVTVSALATGIVGGYLATALIEEVLFRGLIQNLLRQRLRSDWVALPIAAVVFGLAHLNNQTAGFPVPNWMYVIMASLAGLAYGWVWMRTRKVTASAITHMLVNLLWGLAFV